MVGKPPLNLAIRDGSGDVADWLSMLVSVCSSMVQVVIGVRGSRRTVFVDLGQIRAGADA